MVTNRRISTLIPKTKERIQKAFDNINKLGVTQNVYLSKELLNLKFEELFLTHEFELKIHAEKEEQRFAVQVSDTTMLMEV